MDSELASDGIQSDRIFAGSTRNCLDSGVAPGLLFKPVFKDINSTVAGSAGKRSSFFDYWFGGVFMLLKLIVLSSASLTLWLVPLVGLDKKVGWHKGIQGASLCAAVACAVTAGNIARKQSDQEEIEAIKTRAITADVIDEISTSVYISQQQRQQEAELILTSPGLDVEESRKALEAIYSNDLQDSTSPDKHPDYPMYLEVCKSREAGKSTTWIVENILKMGGRKFSDGKVKLQTLLNQFEEQGK
jgi:hypothetical protein